MIIKLQCDSKEAKMDHVQLRLGDLSSVFLKIHVSKKNILHDNQNIGPIKYRFQLSIFKINYMIDDIDYRLLVGHTTTFKFKYCFTRKIKTLYFAANPLPQPIAHGTAVPFGARGAIHQLLNIILQLRILVLLPV
jgi:hypothetical protein